MSSPAPHSTNSVNRARKCAAYL